ncbi:OLC1v1033646C2 [Oldenlandia corymbosa var. corymbosa]|uniref:OLC1v1033646C2 n=1 Tax=Oldenlandia corymbosa var. corymbosa TaxID=529605 RepID=A0AAV1CPG4_OLDCO|nr:OLC1v1033646C2 [Oldenlandia corymbosa var. corymbosa]
MNHDNYINVLTDSKKLKEKPLDYGADDRFEFDPEECSITNGKWVFNRSIKPLYTDSSCPYLDRQVSCVKNGRNDSDYLYWHWQLDDCMLPRFNPEIALRKLQGKRLMFVGDSLQRGQWQSFVCLVESVIPKSQKSMKRGRVHSVFKAKEYNATIEFYWAPFLIESNSDVHIIGDPKQRILKIDSVAKHAQNWIGVDTLVFNTYVWWMSGLKIKSLWGNFSNGEEGYEELEAPVSYRIGLKTWANWVDTTIDPNKTRVFFTTMSPTHQRSEDWGNKDGIKCFNETKPILNRWHWGSGSDRKMMNVVSSVASRMKTPITFINITQLSEYRIDAHSSVYTELQGQLLTEEQRNDPLHFADCIHWCLPGVPDTWNQLLFAHL